MAVPGWGCSQVSGVAMSNQRPTGSTNSMTSSDTETRGPPSAIPSPISTWNVGSVMSTHRGRTLIPPYISSP